MKGYGEYKCTDEFWLPQLPTHWRFQKVKRLFSERIEKGHPDKPLLAATQNKGVVLKKDYGSRTVEATKDLHLLKLVRFGDFVISLRSFQGGIEYSHANGIISPAYTVMIPSSKMVSGYFRYFAKIPCFLDLLKACVTGIREGQNVDYKKLKEHSIPIPPREEQDQIVRYLDAKVSKINKLIRIKQQQIALLKEKKQAIINQAVTKGLDPNAPMKDSGIAWIGQIPEGWEVVRFKHLLTRIDQGVSPQAEARLAAPGEWGVLKSGCVNYGVFRETEHKALPYGYVIDESLSVHVGDMLISRACGSAHLVGSVGIVSDLNYKLILCDKIFRPRFYEDGVKLFCCHAMNSSYFRGQIKEAISGAEGLANNLPVTKLKSFIIALPSTSICHEICDYLKERFLNLDSMSKQLLQEIATLTEYRTRLISDVVTGKVDVRNLPIPDCEHSEFDGTENPMPNKDVTRENNTESEDE